ncbi:MAG: HAMP domain-containing protein [Burkholderiales bacterium]|nr:HAMP domain-containing protein [Burkholderiales bacterium]
MLIASSVLRLMRWRDWSIRTRLLVIAVLPIAYLFFSLMSYSYYARMNEVHDELNSRAKTVTIALAEGVEFHLLSRNVQGIKQMIYSVIQSDRSIYRIDIFDANKKELSHVDNIGRAQPETWFTEMPIKKQLVWVSLSAFEKEGQSVKEKSDVENRNTVLGYVRVTMTGSYKLSMQRHRFVIEVLMSLLALGASTAMAWYLSSGLTRPLRAAMDALHHISHGRTETQMQVDTGGEIGDLQVSINEMATSLHHAKQDLERKVEERTKELMASRNAALKADAEKRRLIHQVNTIVEAERQSIAVEIHDELNASLIALRLESERIVKLAEKARQAEAQEAALSEIQTGARSIIKQALSLYANGRNLVRRLRPEVLELMGLQGAIEEMLRVYNEAQSDCHFSLNADDDLTHLNKDLALSIYRIVQEASSNVLKHTKAKQVKIQLSLQKQETGKEFLHLSLSDNGQGFDPTQAQAGLGITGMRERVLVLNGEFDLQSQFGVGTRIEIWVPLGE